jgi:hypothetical protein
VTPEEYPPNRKMPVREVTPEKVVQRVTVSEPIVRKKGFGQKFARSFVSGDGKTVLGYVMADVVLPAVKDMISDAVSQGVERMLFGESVSGSRRSYRSRGGGSGYVNYSGMSRSSREQPDPIRSRKARATHDFDDVLIATRAEAEEVLDAMFTLLSQYEIVTVANFYELVGVNGSFTDNKWGWPSLTGSKVVRSRNGYLIDLPRPELID